MSERRISIFQAATKAGKKSKGKRTFGSSTEEKGFGTVIPFCFRKENNYGK
jgi:hypothetical protein